MTSKYINNNSHFLVLLPSESLIFMAGCDIICLTAGQKTRGLSEWHAPKSNSLLLSGRPSYNNGKYFLFLLGYFILFYLPIYTDGGWKGGKTFLTVHQIQAFALFALRMHSCAISRSCKSHTDSVPSTETASVLLPKHFLNIVGLQKLVSWIQKFYKSSKSTVLKHFALLTN